MGLSADPDKRARQLDALAAGRRKAAENALASHGSATAKPRLEPDPAPPASHGSATAKPGRRKPRQATFAGGDSPGSATADPQPPAAAKPRPSRGSSKPKPKPAPAAAPAKPDTAGSAFLRGLRSPLG